ncbi:MAG TPA: DUF6152 family protein [Gammaproteobacteria bacterium]
MRRRMHGAIAAIAVGLVMTAMPAGAHHGSAISYDVENLWTTWATVTWFNYANPHPTMTFDRVVGNGEVEHWLAELLTNPSTMARQGWTRKRTLDALAPGTRVKLTLGTSRAGGFSAIVMRIENENGEPIAGGFGGPGAPDLDGVPGGRQPTGDKLLPGEEAAR